MTKNANGEIVSVTAEEAMGVILGLLEALQDRDQRLAEDGTESMRPLEDSVTCEAKQSVLPRTPQDRFPSS